jgi:hypothetical protein
MPGSFSCTAPSSLSPAENSGCARLRIRNGWTSAARKLDLNRPLTTKPECEPGHSQYRYRSQERSYKPVSFHSRDPMRAGPLSSSAR